MRTTAILAILAAAVACGPCGCGPIDVSITTGEGDGSEWTDPTTGEPVTTGSTGLEGSDTGGPSGSTGTTSTSEGSSGEESSEATSTGSSSGEATSSGSDTGDECVPGMPCWCDDLEPPQPCPAASNPFDASCSCYIAGLDCVCPSATVDAALCQPC